MSKSLFDAPGVIAAMSCGAGVRIAVRVFLVGAAGEEIAIEVANLPGFPMLAERSPAQLLAVLTADRKALIRLEGDWRFMTDTEVEDYLRREREDAE
ncbi:hypothetical protein [Segnochrobactrum spirostomi]|uniref:Uncharacterized protein n=1 Tax=Segnochrobactrum spirostomi TaxID=2608987 RepID=A0A6A7Y8V5_9HYPH|nr:hypothetical protein [Segnochrobactrum spirostomi]MQT14411.1 hypothetical protein [Segnochrobactrum spirostomi]